MNFLRYIAISLLSLFIALSIVSCSHASKPSAVPQKPATVEKSPAQALQAPPPQEKKPPEARTVIPVEEQKAAARETNLQEKGAEVGKDEAAALLEDALNVYQEALSAREKGDLDGALKALDEAFAIILKLHIPPESPLFQEKNDLRLMIAQRIQEIYAVRRNPVNGNHKSIPLTENQYVLDEIKLFTGPERKFFEESFRRSGLYIDWIRSELRKTGMPEELGWLPMIESWFQVRALSRARALGLWQFIKSTGLRYGLTRDQFSDERMDPYKATRAAVKYLEELHSFFGDWLTALASYNCGEGRVQFCINTQNVKYLDDFWDLFRRLPFETARFVPRFIAAVLIIQNPGKYGMTLPDPYPPLQFETVTINYPTRLATIAAALKLEAADLVFLNPELLNESTPSRAYELRVPVGYGEKTLQAINTLPKYLPPEYATHVVKSGQTLSQIAAKYGTSAQTLMKVNGLRGTLIRPGQRLKIPTR